MATELIVHGTYSLEKWLPKPKVEELDNNAERILLLNQLQIGNRAREFQQQEAAFPYVAMTEGEYRVWTAFLPTHYSAVLSPRVETRRDYEYQRHTNGRPIKAWRDYTYDTIPHEVLLLIEEAKESRFFTELEIWTPELREKPLPYPDPLCVGWHNGQYYPIVRWGESLLSFEEIKEIVVRRQSTRILSALPFVLFFSSPFILLAVMIAHEVLSH